MIFCHASGGMLREFSGTKVKTGASGEFTACCWSRHSSTLRRRSGGLTMTRHSIQPGCPLFSRVIDWGKRLLFVFLSLFTLAEWRIIVPILASKNTHSVTFVFKQQERPLKCSYFIEPTYQFLHFEFGPNMLSWSNNLRKLLHISLLNTAFQTFFKSDLTQYKLGTQISWLLWQ